MKKTGFKYLIIVDMLVLIAAAIYIAWIITKHERIKELSEEISDTISTDENESYIELTFNSLYKVVYDTTVTVWNTTSGGKVSEFDVAVNSYNNFPKIKQIELDSSGKYLALLDNMNIVSVYNIYSGKCEGTNDDYFNESSHIYFSDDLKYILMVDFSEATVDILKCPGLEYVTYGEMGYYRSNFYWENRNGKLIFYYEIGDSLYSTVFPDDRHDDSLVFSKPVKVNKEISVNRDEK